MNWRQHALCRDEDGDLFFPVGTTGPEVERQTEEAKSICRRCDVTSDCLKWALDAGADAEAGIWGGLAENERRALKRQVLRVRTA